MRFLLLSLFTIIQLSSSAYDDSIMGRMKHHALGKVIPEKYFDQNVIEKFEENEHELAMFKNEVQNAEYMQNEENQNIRQKINETNAKAEKLKQKKKDLKKKIGKVEETFAAKNSEFQTMIEQMRTDIFAGMDKFGKENNEKIVELNNTVIEIENSQKNYQNELLKNVTKSEHDIYEAINDIKKIYKHNETQKIVYIEKEFENQKIANNEMEKSIIEMKNTNDELKTQLESIKKERNDMNLALNAENNRIENVLYSEISKLKNQLEQNQIDAKNEMNDQMKKMNASSQEEYQKLRNEMMSTMDQMKNLKNSLEEKIQQNVENNEIQETKMTAEIEAVKHYAKDITEKSEEDLKKSFHIEINTFEKQVSNFVTEMIQNSNVSLYEDIEDLRKRVVDLENHISYWQNCLTIAGSHCKDQLNKDYNQKEMSDKYSNTETDSTKANLEDDILQYNNTKTVFAKETQVNNDQLIKQNKKKLKMKEDDKKNKGKPQWYTTYNNVARAIQKNTDGPNKFKNNKY